MEPQKSYKGHLFQLNGRFLVMALTIRVFEVVAHLKGWHFQTPNLHMPTPSKIEGLLHWVYLSWLDFRANYIAPQIKALSNFRVTFFLMQLVGPII
ncbi:hypothetical protein AMTRI_Chr13g126030 [Amborella trichopoda]